LDLWPDETNLHVLEDPETCNKYLEQKDKYFAYMRMRKKPWKLTTKRTSSMLCLLEKVMEEQNKEMFTSGTHSVPDRIVSITKSIVRPIVRGKEIKKVEFGAKVNMIQVDSINFTEQWPG
jgi:hypothetical protein